LKPRRETTYAAPRGRSGARRRVVRARKGSAERPR
jgi:hypothetical protein